LVDEQPHVTIYTDGGADPNPGPGGWGVVLIHDSTGAARDIKGGEPQTTNNRMELRAALEALSALKQRCNVTLYTDSTYLQQGITRWIKSWKKNNWQKKNGQDVQNADLWKQLDWVVQQHDIQWEWVKGHTGNQYNERAHRLASGAIREQYQPTTRTDPASFEAYLLASARGNKGYWGVLHRAADGHEEIYWSEETSSSSNRLELIAAYNAILATPERATVRLLTMSDYLRNGATKWAAGWQKRGWKTKAGDPVANMDIWQEILDLMRTRRVEFPVVKFEDMQFEFEDAAERVREEIEAALEDLNDDDLTWAE